MLAQSRVGDAAAAAAATSVNVNERMSKSLSALDICCHGTVHSCLQHVHCCVSRMICFL